VNKGPWRITEKKSPAPKEKRRGKRNKRAKRRKKEAKKTGQRKKKGENKGPEGRKALVHKTEKEDPNHKKERRTPPAQTKTREIEKWNDTENNDMKEREQKYDIPEKEKSKRNSPRRCTRPRRARRPKAAGACG
jgi:hypothetical protein